MVTRNHIVATTAARGRPRPFMVVWKDAWRAHGHSRLWRAQGVAARARPWPLEGGRGHKGSSDAYP